MNRRSLKLRKEYDQEEYHKLLRCKLLDNEPLEPSDKKYLHVLLQRASANGASDNGISSAADEVCKMEHKSTQTDKVSGLMDISELLQWLKSEKSKKTPDKEGIDNAMIATFDHRRDFILMRCPRVRTIYEVYPTLFDLKQVISEFCRIKDPATYNIYLDNVAKYRSRINKYASKQDVVAKTIKAAREEFGNDDVKLDYLESAGAILLLPSLLNENLDDFICFNNEVCKWDFPYIICDSSIEDALCRNADFSIFVEKHDLCHTDDFVDAFFALCATYYVFNIEYPEQCVQTMSLIEWIFLQIPVEISSPPIRVKELQKLLTRAE